MEIIKQCYALIFNAHIFPRVLAQVMVSPLFCDPFKYIVDASGKTNILTICIFVDADGEAATATFNASDLDVFSRFPLRYPSGLAAKRILPMTSQVPAERLILLISANSPLLMLTSSVFSEYMYSPVLLFNEHKNRRPISRSP